MYHPPGNGLIDVPMLSKFLYVADTHLTHRTRICLLGGSALQMLGVRELSHDIDAMPFEYHAEVVEAFRLAERAVVDGKVAIEIDAERKGMSAMRYPLPRSLVAQVISEKIPTVPGKGWIRLPPDFQARAHGIKTIPWMMPATGKIEQVQAGKLLSHLDICTPSVLDLVCQKIFALRDKDARDLQLLLKTMPLPSRFLFRYAGPLRDRFLEYEKANEHDPELVGLARAVYERLRKDNTIRLLPV